MDFFQWSEIYDTDTQGYLRVNNSVDFFFGGEVEKV